MNKQQFLADLDVNSFVDWLAQKLSNKKLSHHYGMPSGKNITFNGLEDALTLYEWPFSYVEPPAHITVRSGRTYSDSAKALTGLCAGLVGETAVRNDSGVRDWAIAVLGWGGVRNGNVTWLNSNVIGLAAEISAATVLLQNGDDDKLVLGTIRRFNAGMTKVYSLLVDNFIIYDSRVAAALAWLVVRWCQDTKRLNVPLMARFPCMRPKEGDNPTIRKSRNPSSGNYSFPWMNNHRINHAHWNIRASWILSEVLNRSTGTLFHTQANPLRALEAALFMWGYDLSQNSPCSTGKDDDHEEDVMQDQELAPQQPAWYSTKTLSGEKAVNFDWCFDQLSDSVVIKRANGTTEEFKIGEIFQIIHVLYDIFGSDFFPLANSVTGMPAGTEKPGLGSTIYALSGKTPHAQAASQLGVILMEMKIFEFYKQRSIAWRLCVEPPSTIEDLRMAF